MPKTLRLAALDHAKAFVGVVERPPGSNRGEEIDRWNAAAGAPPGSPWCCSFVHAMFAAAGFELRGGASVEAVLTAAREAGWLVARPLRGDLACFDFHEGDRYGPYGDHIGFVERVLALRWAGGRFTGWIATVEGNTGDGVFRRRRWLRGIGAEFVRVPGEAAAPETPRAGASAGPRNRVE